MHFLQIHNLKKYEALSIERTAKNKRKGSKGINPIQKRLNVLLPILNKYPHCKCIYFKK